jgi:hypothetical protein
MSWCNLIARQIMLRMLVPKARLSERKADLPQKFCLGLDHSRAHVRTSEAVSLAIMRCLSLLNRFQNSANMPLEQLIPCTSRWSACYPCPHCCSTVPCIRWHPSRLPTSITRVAEISQPAFGLAAILILRKMRALHVFGLATWSAVNLLSYPFSHSHSQQIYCINIHFSVELVNLASFYNPQSTTSKQVLGAYARSYQDSI